MVKIPKVGDIVRFNVKDIEKSFLRTQSEYVLNSTKEKIMLSTNQYIVLRIEHVSKLDIGRNANLFDKEYENLFYIKLKDVETGYVDSSWCFDIRDLEDTTIRDEYITFILGSEND